MLALPSWLRVYAAVEPVDLRKGFDALAIAMRSQLGHDPLAGSLFDFHNLRFDRAKSLVWMPSGWCLVYERRGKGHFHLPREVSLGDGALTIAESRRGPIRGRSEASYRDDPAPSGSGRSRVARDDA
ncbi:MAG: IS66 family insertion sequence element accessory protein TnpB [Deltaproteobacteria bacterium]